VIFEEKHDSGTTLPATFIYTGHQIEIVPPDTTHLLGKHWQIKIDGVLQRNFLFSSARIARDQAGKFIDREEE
jgi:hypothetical protein